MAFSEFETHRYASIVEAYVEANRPPPNIRQEVDLAYRVENQSIVIYHIRPTYRDPEKKMELPFFKTTYVKTSNDWQILWMKSDLKWHRYDPDPVVDSLEEALEVLDADEFACFRG